MGIYLDIGDNDDTDDNTMKDINELQSMQEIANTVQQRCEKQYYRYSCTEPSSEYVLANQCSRNKSDVWIVVVWD